MLIKLFTDFLLYIVSFKVIEYLKRGELHLLSRDTSYLILILAAVLISSLLTGKYNITSKPQIVEKSRPLFKSLILSLGIIAVYFNLFSDSSPSRLLISGTLFLGFFIEIIIQIFSSRIKFRKSFSININFSPLLIMYELLLLIFAILYPYLSVTSLSINNEFYSLTLLLLFWFGSALFTHQFSSPKSTPNYWHFIWGRIKAYLLLVAFSSFMVYILIPENLSSIYPFYISVLFSISAFFVNTLYYLYITQSKTDETPTKFFRATQILDEPLLKTNSHYTGKYGIKGNPFNYYLAEQLSNVYLKKFKEIFSFIDETLDLYSFDFRNSFMIKSADTFNIEVMPDNKLEFYMNLRELNDIQRINKYLKSVNDKLITGGVFVGAVEPLCLRKERFFKKYPFYFANIFYFFDFFWKRFFPKMPLLKRIYFSLTKGKSRTVSLSEILGRIFFCGFDLLNFKQVGNLVYFVAVKKNPPLTDTNPSYGPFIKLKRIGRNSESIHVYKFRTMYPYSEYLQSFVYDKAKLQSGGKFKDDFRITSWGRIMRKLWLDEFPMFINFFKGQLKLVGVRPLSRHYFNLYPEELQVRRIKYKPGLVPPFYADLPKTLDEIVASEVKYLDSYEKHPFTTDIKYFFKAAKNILFNHARSS